MATRRNHLERLRQRLRQRRDHLRRTLGEDWQPLEVNLGESPADAADVASEVGLQEMHYRAQEMEARELALIEWALRKFQQGQYGVCEHCGRKISLARLEVLPFARYCITCQRQFEADAEPSGSCNAAWERVYEMERYQNQLDVDLSDLEAEMH